jgi:hypothetical protein
LPQLVALDQLVARALSFNATQPEEIEGHIVAKRVLDAQGIGLLLLLVDVWHENSSLLILYRKYCGGFLTDVIGARCAAETLLVGCRRNFMGIV